MDIRINFSNGIYKINNNNLLSPEHYKKYVVKATEKIFDEDIKTHIAQNKPIIPEGTKLDICGLLINVFGNFVKVEYKNKIYFVDPKYLKIIKKEEYKMEDVKFINESGLEFTDISSEAVREYNFPNGTNLIIEKPLYLNVSESGGHRVFSADGWSYYIQPRESWFIKWFVKPGKPNFVK